MKTLLDNQNTAFKQAVSFVNHTNQHIFLTGKAGTGKTTFLRYIREHTYKKVVIVAPTGVAAINAGGTTIHALFFLPFGMYLADHPLNWNDKDQHIYNKQRLFGKVKLTHQRRALLQEIDLLVIDEVSMLRADALDAIDAILRSVRRNATPFGGVQMLYIGDLYQLPPVVKAQEATLLSNYYNSSFFFDANVIQEAPPVLLELNKIYRQSDRDFIDLLNNIRNNTCTAEHLSTINAYYQPGFSPKKDENYITLTSHNYLADQINQRELDDLPGKVFCFEASIAGDFQESSYPTESKLYLKEGAQIMFVKNDKGDDRRYYNGKIGVVEKISPDTEEIMIQFKGESGPLKLEKEEWKNQRSNYDPEADEIKEETLGTFKQYPIRLAWAVTIHKSQGLTFNKAIVDAGSSFAAGQVYVALSRLTSLNGLVLTSKINAHNIRTDPNVARFSTKTLKDSDAKDYLSRAQQQYLLHNLSNTFLWNKLTLDLNTLKNVIPSRNIPDKASAFNVMASMANACTAQHHVAEKYRNWLNKQFLDPDKVDYETIHQRTKKASEWFLAELNAHIIQPLTAHINSWNDKKKNKSYHKEISNLLISCKRKEEQLKQSAMLTQALLSGQDLEVILDEVAHHHRIPVEDLGIEPTKIKKVKGETFKQTLTLFKKGKTIEEIAEKRQLTPSTVIGHLIRFVGKEIDINELMSPEKFDYLAQTFKDNPDKTLTELRQVLAFQFSFEELRIAKAAIEHI